MDSDRPEKRGHLAERPSSFYHDDHCSPDASAMPLRPLPSLTIRDDDEKSAWITARGVVHKSPHNTDLPTLPTPENQLPRRPSSLPPSIPHPPVLVPPSIPHHQPTNSYPVYQRQSMVGPIRTRDNVQPVASGSSSAAAAGSAGASTAPKQPPRPENPWIIYRKEKLKEIKDQVEAGLRERKPQSELSKVISQMWAKEPSDVRREYEYKANLSKERHAMQYPDYQFKPMKKEEKEKARAEKKAEREREREVTKARKANGMLALPLPSPSPMSFASTPGAGPSSVAAFGPPPMNLPTSDMNRFMVARFGQCGPSPPLSEAPSPFGSPEMSELDLEDHEEIFIRNASEPSSRHVSGHSIDASDVNFNAFFIADASQDPESQVAVGSFAPQSMPFAGSDSWNESVPATTPAFEAGPSSIQESRAPSLPTPDYANQPWDMMAAPDSGDSFTGNEWLPSGMDDHSGTFDPLASSSMIDPFNFVDASMTFDPNAHLDVHAYGDPDSLGFSLHDTSLQAASTGPIAPGALTITNENPYNAMGSSSSQSLNADIGFEGMEPDDEIYRSFMLETDRRMRGEVSVDTNEKIDEDFLNGHHDSGDGGIFNGPLMGNYEEGSLDALGFAPFMGTVPALEFGEEFEMTMGMESFHAQFTTPNGHPAVHHHQSYASMTLDPMAFALKDAPTNAHIEPSMTPVCETGNTAVNGTRPIIGMDRSAVSASTFPSRSPSDNESPPSVPYASVPAGPGQEKDKAPPGASMRRVGRTWRRYSDVD